MKALLRPLDRASKATRDLVVGPDGAPPAPAFPLRVTVAGVAVVVVSADDYRDMASAKLRLPSIEARVRAAPVLARGRRRPLPSSIERDAKVAAFLREAFDLAPTIDQAHAACLERFGVDRTPSRSRVGRLRIAERKKG